jgi:putative transcriptional regulator
MTAGETNELPFDDAPLSDSTLAGMRHPPLAKRARLRAGLSQQVFADTYGIPVGTLRDWEQRRAEPDAAAAAYLRAIFNDSKSVATAYNKPAAA